MELSERKSDAADVFGRAQTFLGARKKTYVFRIAQVSTLYRTANLVLRRDRLRCLATGVGLGRIDRRSLSFSMVENGDVKTFRYVPQPTVIRAVVQSLDPNDHDGWPAFAAHQSADPFDDFGWFHVTVGATDIEGGNDFQLCVSTPRAVNRAKLDGAVPGILVDRFDAQSVHDAIHERINSIEAHTWDQIVNECRTFMRWEYEGMAGT